MRKLWLDTETLGLDESKYPLVQIAALFDNLEFNQACYWEETPQSVSAFLIRGTNSSHEELVTPHTLATNFLSFLKQCRSQLNPYEKLTPCGHNIHFDLRHLDAFFHRLNYHDFLQALDYHTVDTMILAAILKDTNRLPMRQSLSLSSLAQHFGIKNELAHDALSDVRTTRALYEAMTASFSNHGKGLIE